MIGGGASRDYGYPLWGEICNKILGVCRDAQSTFVEDLWLEYSTRFDLDPDSELDDTGKVQELIDNGLTTDHVCSMASNSRALGSKVGKLLEEEYRFPDRDQPSGPPPYLFYEIVAHLLKHGFIDHIINFNFDGLLEEAVKNELGPGEYDLVFTDHTEFSSQTTGKPRIAKLHGSALAGPSMRYREEDTGALTPKMKEVLRELLFSDSSKVHIVSVGYQWIDQDLLDLLGHHHEMVERTTVIRLSNKVPNGLKEKLGNDKVEVIATRDLAGDGKPVCLDHLSWALWNSICEKVDKQELMPLSRHLVLSLIHGPALTCDGVVLKDRTPNFLCEHTPRGRFAIELLLHTIKCRGMINSSTIADIPRIHRYLKALTENERVEGVLENTLELFAEPDKFPDVRDSYLSSASSPAEFVHLFERIDEQVKNWVCTAHVDVPSFEPSGEDLVVGFHQLPAREFLEEQVQTILEAIELEFASNSDPKHDWLFVKPNSITTFPALRACTRQIIDGRWSHLFVVAESGSWLQTYPDWLGQNGRDVYLCSARIPKESDWRYYWDSLNPRADKARKALLQSGCKGHFGKLLWWEHNRHLCVGFDETRNKFSSAIFYRRPQKSIRVSPVFLDHPVDCAEVFLTFVSYVKRVAVEANTLPDQDDHSCRPFVQNVCEFLEGHGPKLVLTTRQEERQERLLEELRRFH